MWNAKLIGSFVTAGIWAVVMIALLIHWGDGNSLLAAFVGTPFGWALGILLAPYPEEAKKFGKVSKGLFGLFSGITITKVFDWFEKLSDSQKEQVWNELVLRRVAFGVSSLLVTAIVVFIARTYWQAQAGE
jgi:hypothetical protein